MPELRHAPKTYSDVIGVDVPASGLAATISRISRALADFGRAWNKTMTYALQRINDLAGLPSRADVKEARALLARAEVQRLIHDREALAAAIEVKVSGAECAYWIRTGLGTWIYHNDAAVDVLVKRTMRARPEDPDDPVLDMTVAHRARLAAAAIRGYVERGAGA